MSDMKCPFCNGELERVYSRPFQLICAKCGSLGTDELWQELIRTRKVLEIAVDALKTVRRYTAINQFAPKSREAHIVAKKAVAEITALEQKEVK